MVSAAARDAYIDRLILGVHAGPPSHASQTQPGEDHPTRRMQLLRHPWSTRFYLPTAPATLFGFAIPKQAFVSDTDRPCLRHTKSRARTREVYYVILCLGRKAVSETFHSGFKWL